MAARYAAGGSISGAVAELTVTTGINIGMNKVEPWLRKAIAK